jgi:hypothetical protein
MLLRQRYGGCDARSIAVRGCGGFARMGADRSIVGADSVAASARVWSSLPASEPRNAFNGLLTGAVVPVSSIKSLECAD